MNDNAHGPRRKAADPNWGSDISRPDAGSDTEQTRAFAPVQQPPQDFSQPQPPYRQQPPYPYTEVTAGSKKKGRGGLVFLIVGGVVVAAGVAVGLVFATTGDNAPSPRRVTSTIVVDENGRPAGGGDTGQATAADGQMEPAKTTAARPRVKVPAAAESCGDAAGFNVYKVTDRTSCPFSLAVAGAAADTGGERQFGATEKITAFSPVTGKDYEMTCQSLDFGDLQCRGGNNAVVFLQKR